MKHLQTTIDDELWEILEFVIRQEDTSVIKYLRKMIYERFHYVSQKKKILNIGCV